MTNYDVDFTYSFPEFGTITLDAASEEEAKVFALEEVKDTYPEALDIVVTRVTKNG